MNEERIQFAKELFERLEGRNRVVMVQDAQRKLRILEVLSR